MEIIYATTNEDKRNQVQSFLDYNNYDVKIITLKDIGFNEEIEENGETFEENSYIKAKAVKEYCNKKGINKIIVADDGGLMVDALGRKTRSTYSKICRRSCTSRKSIRKTFRRNERCKRRKQNSKIYGCLNSYTSKWRKNCM